MEVHARRVLRQLGFSKLDAIEDGHINGDLNEQKSKRMRALEIAVLTLEEDTEAAAGCCSSVAQT